MDKFGYRAKSVVTWGSAVLAVIGAVVSAGCDSAGREAATVSTASAVSTTGKPDDQTLAASYGAWATKYRKMAAADQATSARLKGVETALSSAMGGVASAKLAALDASLKTESAAATLATALANQAQAAANLHTQLASASDGGVQ